MAERRTAGLPVTIVAGGIIGAVAAVLAISFAALVFGGGYLADFIADGISLYLGAAALTLAILAWRARLPRGGRGPAAGGGGRARDRRRDDRGHRVREHRARPSSPSSPRTLVVTVLCGVVFLVLGTLRLGQPLRFVPYPVVGGFIAGTGWLLLKSGIYVASDESPFLTPIGDLCHGELLQLWLPAFAFGVILLIATRLVKRPLVIPAVLGIGLVLFAIGMVVTGSSIESARSGHWLLLGPFDDVPSVAAVDAPRAHRRRLVGGARAVGRDPRPPCSWR